MLNTLSNSITWGKKGRERCWPNLRYYPCTFFERLRGKGQLVYLQRFEADTFGIPVRTVNNSPNVNNLNSAARLFNP